MVRAGPSGSARLPLVEVDMLSLEEALNLGVLMTEEQIDFYHHPEDRLAVAVYGVPDPDRLYIAGPDHIGTCYQIAPEGAPADEHGLTACVLPLVVQAGNQEQLAQVITSWEGDSEEYWPAVHAEPHGAEFMYPWSNEEAPVTIAAWDLWPITADEVQHWLSAADKAYGNSALPAMFELIDNYNGSEYYGPRAQELDEEIYELERRIRNQDGPRAGELDAQLEELKAAYADQCEDYIHTLEKEILHPVTGDPDPQVPPVDLPPEQAAIWRSLQSLSWRNWAVLNKQSSHDGDALYGGRFVEANRRLCPWY